MSELDRILDLPLADLDAEALAAEYTDRFRVLGGKWTLRPPQAAALHWIEQLGGGLFPMGVGVGKTLVAYLAPRVLGVDAGRVLVLCPAELRDQYHAEGEIYADHFDVPRPLNVVSYSKLSRSDELDDICGGEAPRLIICDEAHNLRNKDAGRTKKFRRYLLERPQTSVVAMSATLTTSSLWDYAHLAEWALGKANTPLPTSYSRLAAWARIVDSKSNLGPQPTDWHQIGRLMDDPRFRPEDADELGAVGTARAAFRRRLATTPGVVRTLEPSSDAPLNFEFLDSELANDEILGLRERVEASWVLPDGSEIDDPLRANAKLRQLSQGFWYYWDWPGEVDREWLYARNELAREIRRVVRDNRRGWDTRGDVERAMDRGEFYDGRLEAAWNAWLPVCEREQPPTKPEWYSNHALAEALRLATAAICRGDNPIIWYTHRAVADRFESEGDISVDFEIARAGEGVKGDRPGLIASVPAHGTGLNLQKYNWNLVLCPPASGSSWEQLVGRTHRQGQQREVTVVVNRSTPELHGAWRSAIQDARYLRDTQGVPAKILEAEE